MLPISGVGIIILPIFQMRLLRLGSKWWSQHLHPGSLTPEPVLLNDTVDICLPHLRLIISSCGEHPASQSSLFRLWQDIRGVNTLTADTKVHCRGELNLFKKIHQETTTLGGAEEDEG